MRVSIVPIPEGGEATGAGARPRRRHAVSAPPPGSSTRVVLRRASRQALTSLLFMVRNVAVSAVAAIGAAFLTSCGNAFSSVPTAQQSHRMFLVASLLTTHVLGTSFGLLIAASRLMTKRFIVCNARRPGLCFALVRVVRFGAVHMVISTAAVFAMGYGCASLPARVRAFKPEYYFHTLIGQYFSSACDANVRAVLNHETVEGRERQQQRTASLPSLRPPRSSSPVRRWWRSFLQSLPLLSSSMVAGLYIHSVNQWTFAAGHRVNANLFVGGSLALKLALQELAKRFLLARGVTSLQHMCILVGVPTVLIDTQARVVVLGLQDASAMLANTYAMAAVELAVRFAKLLWLRRAVRKGQEALLSSCVAATVSPKQPTGPMNTIALQEDPRVAFAKWRKQLVGLHTAETLADMYAEYIAIVCSAAVAIFWSTSSQYTVGGGEASAGRRALPLTLSVQVIVELLVDYVASVVEIAGGVELDHARGFGAFLGSLFLMLTIVNMNMSAVLYVRDD